MRISVIIPTCYRPVMFVDMLNSLYETTHNHDIETIVLVDGDRETYKIACNNKLVSTVNFSDEMRGAGYCWNRGLYFSSGEIIVPAGDDQKFYPNWLDYALESHQKQLGGYGVVGMNDLAYDGNIQLATMLLFDRAYCKEVMGGVIAPPVYNYYCIDSEWNAKAKMLNHFYWDERSIVEHLHVAHGKRPFDDHDKNRVDNNYAELDNVIFEERKAQNFPITWDSLI